MSCGAVWTGSAGPTKLGPFHTGLMSWSRTPNPWPRASATRAVGTSRKRSTRDGSGLDQFSRMIKDALFNRVLQSQQPQAKSLSAPAEVSLLALATIRRADRLPFQA